MGKLGSMLQILLTPAYDLIIIVILHGIDLQYKE
jgi:hypothetical protein